MPTAAGIKQQELEETKRHNKASLEEHLGSTLGGSAIGALGRLGAAMLKKNDPELYKRVISLFETSANLPFPVKKGRPITSTYTPEGVAAVFTWVPTIGTTRKVKELSPFMVAAKDLFGTIRGRNSGSTNYDAVDLMIVTLAIDSIMIHVRQALRALRTANRTEDLSPVTRKHIVETMGWDCDDLVANKDRYLNVLNKAIVDLNTLYLPGGLSYFTKHSYLATWILTEKDTNEEGYKRTNFYIPNCPGYFIYDEANGELDYTEVTGTMTADKLKQMFDRMLSPLINSDAVEIMTGDIKNAVDKGAISESAIIKLEPLTSDSISVSPYNYDKDMLMQLRNAMITSPLSGQYIKQFSIHQAVDNGTPYIYQGDIISPSAGPVGIQVTNAISHVTDWWSDSMDELKDLIIGNKPLIVTTHDCPQPDEVIESTRLLFSTNYFEPIDGMDVNHAHWTLSAHGSEIVTKVRLYYYESEAKFNNDVISYIDILNSFEDFDLTLGSGLASGLAKSRLIRCFKYFPIFSIIFHDRNNNNILSLVNYQCYNYRKVSDYELRPLHECALRSEFAFNFSNKSEVTEDGKAKGNDKSKNNKNSGKNYWKKNKKSKQAGKDKNSDEDKESKKDKSGKDKSKKSK
jgi:hypothetical protein